MEKTWKPTTAGILSIIAGALEVIGGIIVLTVGAATTGAANVPNWMMFFSAAAIPMLILGIVAIVGGVYALKRRIWGLALAGAICSLFGAWFILGILAIIFVIMGKGEFQ